MPCPARSVAADAAAADAASAASASASAPAAAPSAEEAAAAAAHARAVRRFLGGDADGALEDAFFLVKKHRGWRNGAGRELALRFIAALGPADARADKARRRLSNLWFV